MSERVRERERERERETETETERGRESRITDTRQVKLNPKP